MRPHRRIHFRACLDIHALAGAQPTGQAAPLVPLRGCAPRVLAGVLAEAAALGCQRLGASQVAMRLMKLGDLCLLAAEMLQKQQLLLLLLRSLLWIGVQVRLRLTDLSAL